MLLSVRTLSASPTTALEKFLIQGVRVSAINAETAMHRRAIGAPDSELPRLRRRDEPGDKGKTSYTGVIVLEKGEQ